MKRLHCLISQQVKNCFGEYFSLLEKLLMKEAVIVLNVTPQNRTGERNLCFGAWTVFQALCKLFRVFTETPWEQVYSSILQIREPRLTEASHLARATQLMAGKNRVYLRLKNRRRSLLQEDTCKLPLFETPRQSQHYLPCLFLFPPTSKSIFKGSFERKG